MTKKDIMELLYRIQNGCKNATACTKCQWFSKNSGECMFFEDPDQWNVPEIVERSDEK